MSTKTELEKDLAKAEDELTKFRGLQFVPIKELEQTCSLRSCTYQADFIVETPKREVYICSDCMADLDCFLADFDLKLKNY